MFRFPPASRVTVLGETLEYVCAGAGPTTVVLVNGAGGPLEGWWRVFAPLAAQATVFAYNRPGLGGSSRPVVPQVGSHLVASLRAVLEAAGLSPRHVLVGHSLGGLVVNLFARLHPDEVSAVVLLEATSPEDVAAQARHQTGVQRLLEAALDRLAPQDPNAEALHLAATAAELHRAPPFPDVPLWVVTGGRPAMAWATPAAALAARAANQRALAALSPRGTQRLAGRSGHFPQLTEPELVVEVVRAAVEAAAGRGARPRAPNT
jgi:pimeloyl-ACP methyl ester carboxylesterase